ncbi:TRP1 [Candida theae]|uniref:N-(5'-phosphoribosyl)anthranilate isomerase n=1 Tax=Candida theae TaxID=1198502 RepID=A0AAD5BJ73_9ASCO|nr:TRP1 [Candida theae]KAI5966687.1 TRP1 [Candida theae]
MKLVKICGVKTIEAAETAMLSGADLIGCILVPNKSRTCDIETAKQIAQYIKQGRPQSISQIMTRLQSKRDTFTSPVDYFEYVQKLILDNGPFLVGVFQNQSRDEVLSIARRIGLDFIQLHGSEPKLDFVNDEFGLVFRYVVPRDTELMREHGLHMMRNGVLGLPLLDSEQGGEGKVIDWDYVSGSLPFTRAILAGGLTPDNIRETMDVKNVIGFDVSGGVETDGKKDLTKIAKFVNGGKSIY